MKSPVILVTFVLTLVCSGHAGSEPGPPGPPGPPGAPGEPAPCQGDCVSLGCEPACLVGCCGYHGMYGKSGKWIRSVLESITDDDQV